VAADFMAAAVPRAMVLASVSVSSCKRMQYLW